MGRDSRREPLDQGPCPAKPRLHLLIVPRGLPVVGRGVTGDPRHGPHGLRVVIGDSTGRDPRIGEQDGGHHSGAVTPCAAVHEDPGFGCRQRRQGGGHQTREDSQVVGPVFGGIEDRETGFPELRVVVVLGGGAANHHVPQGVLTYPGIAVAPALLLGAAQVHHGPQPPVAGGPPAPLRNQLAARSPRHPPVSRLTPATAQPAEVTNVWRPAPVEFPHPGSLLPVDGTTLNRS